MPKATGIEIIQRRGGPSSDIPADTVVAVVRYKGREFEAHRYTILPDGSHATAAENSDKAVSVAIGNTIKRHLGNKLLLQWVDEVFGAGAMH